MMNNETKVGMTVIAGLAVLMGIVSFLGLFRFSSDSYIIYINFQRATGLKPGNAVNYVGVPVGQVDKIEVAGNSARVSALIKNDVKIPEGSNFWIGSEGVMGAMYIDIDPPAGGTGQYMTPGGEARGNPGASMNDFMMTAASMLQKLGVITDSLNRVFGDQDVQDAIIATTKNTKEITQNMKIMTGIFTEVAGQNQQDVNKMINQMGLMAESLNQAAARVSSMLAGIDNGGQTAREVVDTLRNLKQASENIEKITKSVEGLTSDPATRENAKEAVKNARQAGEKANKLLGVFTDSEKQLYFDFKYGDKPDDYRVDAALRLDWAPRRFFVFGVSDIGEDKKLNLQYGYDAKAAAFRGGVISGKAGLGVDLTLFKGFRLFADAYDPNRFKVRVGGEFLLSDRWSLIGETLDARKKADRSFYMGLRGYF